MLERKILRYLQFRKDPNKDWIFRIVTALQRWAKVIKKKEGLFGFLPPIEPSFEIKSIK